MPLTRRQRAQVLLRGSRASAVPPPIEEPRPPAATTGVAGSPGTFLPDGAAIPKDGAAIEALDAEPATAWAPGEYVAAQNGDERYWDGALTWLPGRAPEVPAPEGA